MPKFEKVFSSAQLPHADYASRIEENFCSDLSWWYEDFESDLYYEILRNLDNLNEYLLYR